MELVILTGASRGLGAAMAERLLSPSRQLVCIARSPNEPLAARAGASGARLDYRLHDLSDASATAQLAHALGETLRAAAGVSRFVLINLDTAVDDDLVAGDPWGQCVWVRQRRPPDG